MNSPINDTFEASEALVENDDTSNVRHESILPHHTVSIEPRVVVVQTDRKDKTIQDEPFSRCGKYKLRGNSNPNFSDSYKYSTGAQRSITTMACSAINVLFFFPFFGFSIFSFNPYCFIASNQQNKK